MRNDSETDADTMTRHFAHARKHFAFSSRSNSDRQR